MSEKTPRPLSVPLLQALLAVTLSTLASSWKPRLTLFQEMRTYPSQFFPRSTRPPRAKTCLTSAREDLQAIASALEAAPLGSDTPIFGFKLETAADFMPREENFSKSVFRGVTALQEPRLAWQVPDKASTSLFGPLLQPLSAVTLSTLVSSSIPRPICIPREVNISKPPVWSISTSKNQERHVTCKKRPVGKYQCPCYSLSWKWKTHLWL